MLQLLFVLLFLALSAFCARVKLKGTTVIGLDLPTYGIEFYGGIPFAESPVGKLRFHAPVLKADLRIPSFNATDFGKSCLQPAIYGLPAEQQSEDCLSINIHRPAGTKAGAKLPILMWTYGGAFLVGGASQYNGSELVAHSMRRGTPIIHIGFNYRLGPFGYPVGMEAFKQRELNLGQKDMLAALKWLHHNIAAFGGDKDKITMFGESAGAIGIAALYFSKDIEKLMRGAILQSGVAGGFALWNSTERKKPWPSFVKNIPSCAHLAEADHTLACLRNATEEEIKKNYLEPTDASFLGEWWLPTLDSGPSSVFPDFPSTLYKQGRFARIPFIAGNTLDEGTSFAGEARVPEYTEADLKTSIIAPYLVTSKDPVRLERTVDRILELYPDVPAVGSPYRTGQELFGLPSMYKRLSSILGDLTFTFPLRHWMQAAADHDVKSYGYLFSQPQVNSDPALGVPHAAEIPYVFGNTLDATPSGQHLKTVMMDYWISFAVNLDPNDAHGTKRPRWPRYTKSNQVLLELNGGNTTTINDGFRKEQIAYLTANAVVFRR